LEGGINLLSDSEMHAFFWTGVGQSVGYWDLGIAHYDGVEKEHSFFVMVYHVHNIKKLQF
jgi:hypothetical protein